MARRSTSSRTSWARRSRSATPTPAPHAAAASPSRWADLLDSLAAPCEGSRRDFHYRSGTAMNETVQPTAIRLEAASHCQLRCPSCPTTSGAIHPTIGSGFLRAGDFQEFLARNPQVCEVELSNYGELFLNPELSEILRIGHQRGV